MGIGPAGLKKLQDLERELADKIRKFREAEARKASVSVLGKSVIPGDKVQLVRRLSASKPAEKIYSKDVIKLGADSSTNTDSEGEAVKGESSNVEGQAARRKSWLDSNPSLTPNLKIPAKRTHPISPSLADLGKVKAKFRAEGQRSGQTSGGQISKSTETSVEGDLLQWIESSEGKSSPSPDITPEIAKDDLASVTGIKAMKASHLNRIKKAQKEKESKGLDFSALDFDLLLASIPATQRDSLAADWCKDTRQEGSDDATHTELTESSDENLSPFKSGTQGLMVYRSALLAFKAFRYVLISFFFFCNTLLKSYVTCRDHVSVVMDPMNTGSRIVNFIVNFIRDGTVFMKYTTLVHMRSGYA